MKTLQIALIMKTTLCIIIYVRPIYVSLESLNIAIYSTGSFLNLPLWKYAKEFLIEKTQLQKLTLQKKKKVLKKINTFFFKHSIFILPIQC